MLSGLELAMLSGGVVLDKSEVLGYLNVLTMNCYWMVEVLNPSCLLLLLLRFLLLYFPY